MLKGKYFAMMAAAIITSYYIVDAGYCSTKRCEGRSENSCRESYGCTTYEKCTSTPGQYGSVDTITSTCSRYCTGGGIQSCFKDFKSSIACNTESNFEWVGDDDNTSGSGGNQKEEDDTGNSGSSVTNAECQSIEISAGCEGTDMGSIVGSYKPINGAKCSSRPVFVNEDGLTIIYDDSSDRWEIGSLCSESTCSCLEPKVVSVRLQSYRVSCYDGGYGSNKQYSYTDLSIRCIDAGSSNNNINKSGVKNKDEAIVFTAMTVIIAVALNILSL